MTGFEEAYQLILSCATPGDVEKVGLGEALGHILAEDIRTEVDMPPFNRSAMDGYACKRADLGKPLKIIGEVPAGITPDTAVRHATCVKIMTGAEVPEGADCVVRIEDTRLLDDYTVEILEESKADNIRRKGEDLVKGQVLISKGTLLKSQHIGLLAMNGCVEPMVYHRPRTGILSTGSELVDPDKTPTTSGIRNSNGIQLVSQLKSMGVEGENLGIARDDKEVLKNVIEKALDTLDVLLITGGVSMGDYDYVPGVLQELGFDIKLHKMKVRPGKPLLFAVRGRQFAFGLPGNPVSTFVQFEVIIKPFLMRLMGKEAFDTGIRMPLGADLPIKSIPLRFFVPVKINQGLAFPLEYHGSGHLASYAEADGILEIPENTTIINKNELVYVRPIQ